MGTSALLHRLSTDVPETLHYINDLAFDEDCELFLHLGLLGFLAAFIWFMNCKWSWREIFAMLDCLWLVLCEGFLPNYS